MAGEPRDTYRGSTPGAGDAGTRSQVATASGINLLLGLWLIIAPWVLLYSEQNNAVWNQVTIGGALAVLALIRVTSPVATAGLSWVNFVLGAWLVIAPFVLSYSDAANTAAIYWNDILVGLAVLALAAWSAVAGGQAKRRG